VLTEKAMTEEQKALMVYNWVEFNLAAIKDGKLEKGLECGEMRSSEIAASIRCSAEYARR